jgi:putative serine protease PepD
MKRILPTILAGAIAGGVVGLLAADNSSTTKTIVTTTSGATAVASAHPGAEPTALSTSKGLSVNQIFQADGPGVVDIQVGSTTTSSGSGGFFGFGGGQSQQTEAEGSGFVLNKNGDIVTAEHVVTGAQTIKVTFPDGHTATASLVGSDTGEDVAVVHVSVPSSELHPLTVGDSSTLRVGDGVVAIGSPFGLPSTVTAGIVSALGRAITSPNDWTIANAVQTDAAINPGNSGGPLLNAAGQVIGINDQIDTNSTTSTGEGQSSGVGFAVPSNTVDRVAHEIISSGKAQNAYVGVELQPSSTGGAAVAQNQNGQAAVQPGSPAAKAGLRPGDLVTAVDGQTISSVNQFIATIANYSPGDTVTLTVKRSGSTTTVKVTLGTQPKTAASGSSSGGGGGFLP